MAKSMYLLISNMIERKKKEGERVKGRKREGKKEKKRGRHKENREKEEEGMITDVMGLVMKLCGKRVAGR